MESFVPVNSVDPALLSDASPSPAMHPVSPMSWLGWTLAGLPSVARRAVRSAGERDESEARRVLMSAMFWVGRKVIWPDRITVGDRKERWRKVRAYKHTTLRAAQTTKLQIL